MKNIYRYGVNLNSHDVIKILAITTMVVDHGGEYFVDNCVWFRIVGRMAAPLFFFLVGYSGSWRFKTDLVYYGGTLVVVNFLTNPSESMIEHILPLNILLTFVVVKWFLQKFNVAELGRNELLVLLSGLAILSVPSSVVLEYGTVGLGYSIGARLMQQRHPFARIWLSCAMALGFMTQLVFLLVWNDEIDAPENLALVAMALLALVFLLNLLIFLHYHFRTFAVPLKPARIVLLYVSRYSLEIYVIHLAAFRIVAHIWHPTISLC